MKCTKKQQLQTVRTKQEAMKASPPCPGYYAFLKISFIEIV